MTASMKWQLTKDLEAGEDLNSSLWHSIIIVEVKIHVIMATMHAGMAMGGCEDLLQLYK